MDGKVAGSVLPDWTRCGKRRTIALESTALASEYNGIREYDVDNLCEQ